MTAIHDYGNINGSCTSRMLHGLLRSFLSSACHTDVWGVVPTFPPHFVLIFSGDPEVDTLVIGLPASLHDKAYLISSFSWPDQGNNQTCKRMVTPV